MSFAGHNPFGGGGGLWPLIRAWKMLSSRKNLYPNYMGWGWKEPNSHIYLEHMAEYFDHFKYIHTIRHGIDMAFSKNQQQLFNWGMIYEVERPTDKSDIPRASLEYWVKANQRVLEIGKRLGRDKFLMVNFDELCMSPESEIKSIVSFLNLNSETIDYNRIYKIPHMPKSIGRYRNHDLSQFDDNCIDAVRSLGFTVNVND